MRMHPIGTRLSSRRGLVQDTSNSGFAFDSSLSRSEVARALLELASVRGDWSESIRHIVQVGAEVIQVERVSFWSLRDDRSTIHCDAGYVASSRRFEQGATLFKSDHPGYFGALHEARVLEFEDVHADPREADMLPFLEARGIASKLDVPVWVNGALAGVLCHEQVGTKRPWTSEQEEFASGVAQIVASALAVRAQSTAEAKAVRGAFLELVSREAHGSLDRSDVARRVARASVPAVADIALIWELDRDERLCSLASAQADGQNEGIVSEYMRVAGKRGALLALMRQKQALLMPDTRRGEPASTEAQRRRLETLGVRSLIAVPLVLAGKLTGALAFLARGRHYRSEDVSLARRVAERVASALENARLYEMARDAIEARDDFLLLAAHELRTPLAALQLRADAALRRRRLERPEAGTADAEGLAQQVRRLSAFVERMLDAFRIRAEGIALETDSCDLREIVEDRVKCASERAGRAGVTFSVGGEDSLVGRWDHARVVQLVDNLLDNAIKFGGGAPVEIAVGRDGDQAVLTVRDRGIGIPADRVASVFSPFERTAPKERFGGLGLGLYVAREIAGAHGGSIDVASRGGAGTVFTVRLPIHSPPEPADASS
jgi:signal transduction histidine kinase